MEFDTHVFYDAYFDEFNRWIARSNGFTEQASV